MSRNFPGTIKLGGVIYDENYLKDFLSSHTAREVVEQLPDVYSQSVVRMLAKRIGIQLKMVRKSTKHQQYKGGSPSDTLCWQCKKATDASACPWVYDFTPVPGWTATETNTKFKTIGNGSYNITACPLFEKG